MRVETSAVSPERGYNRRQVTNLIPAHDKGEKAQRASRICDVRITSRHMRHYVTMFGSEIRRAFSRPLQI